MRKSNPETPKLAPARPGGKAAGELEHGILAQRICIVTVWVAERDLIQPLAHLLLSTVEDLKGAPGIGQALGERGAQAQAVILGAEQEGAPITGYLFRGK